MRSGFARLHPLVDLTFFVLVLAFAMFLSHPAVQLAGLVCAALFALRCTGRGFGRRMAMLLPLMSNSSSLSGPVYEDGMFRMGMDIDIGLERQYGARVIDPVFQVLKNGDVVQEIPAKISESASSSAPDKDFYAPDTADERLEISCQPSDTVEIHLLCRDSFGLSYDFTVCTYEIDQDGTMVEEVWPVTDYNVEVSWH